MTVSALSTYLFNDRSRNDLSRLQNQLVDLQRQVGSEHKAADLKGYGANSARIISANGMIAQANANAGAAQNLGARFDMVDSALNSTADASESLRLSILSAIGNDDGRFITDALQTAFDKARTALNTSYEGEALFAGERVGAQPIGVATLTDLAAAPSVGAIFDEAARPKTVDLGDGPIQVSEKASDVSTGLFTAMKDLKALIDANGGTLPQPLTSAQKTTLQGLVTSLASARQTLLVAQGQNGETQKRVEADAARLSTHADALEKTVSDVRDADLAEVATRITAIQVQYEALAKTYSNLSQLSLLNYLS
jgi:flagellar hook-associated protein 3 FlgL